MRIGTALWATVISVAAVVGCSSSSSSGGGGAGQPDFNTLQTTLTTPTGTLPQNGEKDAISNATSQQAAGNSGNFLGGSSSGSSTTMAAHDISLETVHILTSCSDLKGQPTGQGSCDCPGGGSLSYNFPSGGTSSLGGGTGSQDNTPVHAVLSINANACVGIGDNKQGTINGSIYFKLDKDDATHIQEIESIHVQVSGTQKDGKYDADFLFKIAGSDVEFTFAVSVPDGTVLVTFNANYANGNGSITIKDKKGTYTCTDMNKVATCMGPDGTKHDGIQL